MSACTKKSTEILKEINNKGFSFGRFDPNNELFESILNTNQPDEKILNFFKKEFENLGFEIREIAGVYEDITEGMSHKLHTHLIPAEFQVVVWVPMQSNYLGREFVYGTREKLKEYHGLFGEMCFMKCNDLQFIHGVNPLKSEQLFRTLLLHVNLLFSDGRHMTVDCDLKDY